MTEQEYLLYLIKLKHFQEFEILKKSLNSNINIYPLKEIEFELWLKENNKLDKFNKEFAKNAPKNLENKNLQAFIDEMLKNKNFNCYENISAEDYIENIKYIIDNSLKAERKQVRIYQYKMLVTFSTGQKFGDHALLPHVNNRTATIITTAECHFGILTKENFNTSVAEADEKMKQEAMHFFINNSLFKGIEKNNFLRNFFNYFVSIRYDRGDSVFREGDISQYIYFIKKGEFEASFFKSIVEINNIIKSLKVNIPNEEVEKEKLEENDRFHDFMNKKQLIKVSRIY